jgi:FixJ family two-component response regulator
MRTSGYRAGESLATIARRLRRTVEQVRARRTTRAGPARPAFSKETVERHRANILEKLGMRDRVELARYAIRRGVVEL